MRVKKDQPIKAAHLNFLFEKHATDPGAFAGPGLGDQWPVMRATAENTDATALDPFSVAVIKASALDANPEQERSAVLQIGTPAAGDNLNAWVIVLEQIPAGAAGKVAIFGVGWADYDGGFGNFARLAAGNRTLTAGDYGSANILATSGTKALVRFPAIQPTSDHWIYYWPEQ